MVNIININMLEHGTYLLKKHNEITIYIKTLNLLRSKDN